MKWITRRARKRLLRKGWNFMGTLPKKKSNMVLIIGPNTDSEDFHRLLAISDLTEFKITFSFSKNDVPWVFQLLLKNTGAVSRSNQVEALVSNKESVAFFLNEKDNDWTELPHYNLLYTEKTPIVLVGIDHHRKLIKFHNPFHFSGHQSRDESFIRGYFSNFFSYAYPQWFKR